MAEPARKEWAVRERHQVLIEELANQFRPIMDLSQDAMYVYLDDENKICNQKLAELWGYSVDEWNTTSPFLDNLIHSESQSTVAETYKKTRINYMPNTVEFTGLRKDGSTFKAVAAIVPLGNLDEFFTINLIKPL